MKSFCSVLHTYTYITVHIYGYNIYIYIYMSYLVQKHVGHILHPAVAGIVLMAMALFLRLMAVQAPLVADRHDQPQFAAILRCVQHVPWLNFTAEWKRVGRCSKRLKKTNPRTVGCKWPTLFRSPCDYHGQHDAWFGHVCAVCDCLEHLMKFFDVLSASRYDLRDTQFVPRILRASANGQFGK